MLNRRTFLVGLVAAPFIVRSGLVMPVNADWERVPNLWMTLDDGPWERVPVADWVATPPREIVANRYGFHVAWARPVGLHRRDAHYWGEWAC
jgi:hypothetical protein